MRSARQVDLSLGLGLAYSLPLAVVAAGVGGGVYWGQTAEQVGIAVLALGLPFTTIATCYTPVFQYHLRFGALALGEVASRVLNLVLVLVIAHFDLGLYALCASQAALPLLRTTIYVVAARRYDRFRPAFSWPEWRSLIVEAAPIGVTVLVAIAYLRLSGLLLSLLRTPEDVRRLRRRVRISTMLTALSAVFGNTVFPALSKTWNSDRSRFTSAVQRCSDAMVVLGLPLVVLGVPLAGPVIHLLASGEIRGAVLPLQLLLVAAAVFFVNSTWSQVLIVAGEERFLVRLLLVELAVHSRPVAGAHHALRHRGRLRRLPRHRDGRVARRADPGAPHHRVPDVAAVHRTPGPGAARRARHRARDDVAARAAAPRPRRRQLCARHRRRRAATPRSAPRADGPGSGRRGRPAGLAGLLTATPQRYVAAGVVQKS